MDKWRNNIIYQYKKSTPHPVISLKDSITKSYLIRHNIPGARRSNAKNPIFVSIDKIEVLSERESLKLSNNAK